MSYICKGNIPKSCSKCPQRTLYHGISVCLAANKMKVSTSNKCRHDNCTLIEIPTPHGRLIDADALLESIKTGFYEHFGDYDSGQELLFDLICGSIEDSPTIIEAEVSE